MFTKYKDKQAYSNENKLKQGTVVSIQFNTAVVRKIININIFGEGTAKYEWIKTLWNYQSAKKSVSLNVSTFLFVLIKQK